MNTSMPSPLAFARPHLTAISPSPAYLMSFVPFLSSSFIYFSRLISIFLNSGALAGTSLYSFLRHPSLKSTALLVAGTSGAGLFYAGATGTKNGLEDGPWLGVAASTLVVAATLPSAIKTFRPSSVIMAVGALAAGSYYYIQAKDE
ncbi:hypothetical protein BDY24DRAFT_79103 [Mrakia frigida]|uniref:uncharacterized protein n=1 Tax=Mrakia frigida TaxID=29902 RepID=UPI003FCC171C